MKKINAKKYFKKLDKIEAVYLDLVNELEDEMKEEYGNDVEFIWGEGECSIIGIGNDNRTMKLIHRW